MLLQNKTALITGCNRGIGRAILETFAENGANIFAHSRKKSDEFENQCRELSEKNSIDITPIYFDITDNEAIKNCFVTIKKESGTLDILVNNAGIMKDALIGMIDQKLMSELFQVNVFSVINMIQYASKLMSRQKSGSIINMASIVGITGSYGHAVYSATKGAVISLTKTASKELCSKGIRVNAIAPGMIDTDMFRSIGKQHVDEYIKKIGLGRLGGTNDVANAALFLASDLSNYITGQIIGVDGGAVL